MKNVTCKSGIRGWQDKIQNVYGSYAEFVSYSENYGLHTRLGYDSPKDAWDSNPTIQGSVAPSDYRKVLDGPKLEKLDCKFGAPMGRPNKLPTDCDIPIKLQLRKMKMVDGDYDSGSAYWGGGSPCMYVAYNDCEETQVFIRGHDREDAKENVRYFLSQAKFYN